MTETAVPNPVNHTNQAKEDTMFSAPATTEAAPAFERRSRSSKRRLLAALLAAGVLLAACGSDEEPATPAAPAEAAATDSGAGPAAVSIGTGSTDVGDVLVDDAGLSLYGFLPDEGGTVTCGGGCAEAWPPVMLPSGEVPDGLDTSIFSVTDGIDGGFQLMAGGWPLYRFAGDAAPGDITGQGSGGNWFLVAPDGSLITDEAAAAVPGTDAADGSETSDGYGY